MTGVSAAAGPSPLHRLGSRLRNRPLVLLPILAVALVALAQLPWAPLGDDWKLYVGFREHGPLQALAVNTSIPEGRRFRPVCYLLVWLEQGLLGLPFALSKAIGLGFLAWAGLVLSGLLRRLGASAATAAGIGTLYCLHPALAEVHGWASTRVDQMATAFALSALCAVLDRRPILAFCLWLAAFGSKEAAYPLLLAGPILGGRLRDLIPAVLAFLTIAVAKVLVIVLAAGQAGAPAVGGALAGGWWALILEVPVAVQLQGMLGYLRPLLLFPLSSAAGPPAGPLLALLWAALLGLAVLRPFVRGLAAPRPRRSAGAVLGDPRLRLALLFALSLVVTGGAPYRPDLDGGRVWTLPLAFLLGALLLRTGPATLVLPCLLALPLLHGNLAPYREADRIMLDTLAVLDREVSAHERAVRVHGLPSHNGPVPLFALMPDPYMRSFDLPERRPTPDRPLVTTEAMELADPSAWIDVEQEWQRYHESRGRTISAWIWDPTTRRIRPH